MKETTRREAVLLLRTARELVSEPARFTTHVLARRGPSTDSVHPTHAEAGCWCGYGAIIRAGHDLGLTINRRIDLIESLGLYWLYDLMNLNDNRGHAAVLDYFDLAIRKAEAA